MKSVVVTEYTAAEHRVVFLQESLTLKALVYITNRQVRQKNHDMPPIQKSLYPALS